MKQLKLLTIDNAKTTHGESLGVLTGILYLNPEVTNKLCPFASSHCRELCLVHSGMAEVFKTVMDARTRKTQWFLSDRAAFIAQLKLDIAELAREAKKLGMRAAVRLNGTSDILFERLIDFAQFPDVQFYDYTKIPLQHRRMSSNYHLTFSHSGTNINECLKALRAGINVAMVFTSDKIPNEYLGWPVIDGTTHDVRFLDPKGVIVGLCPKGRRARRAAKENKNPFFVRA